MRSFTEYLVCLFSFRYVDNAKNEREEDQCRADEEDYIRIDVLFHREIAGLRAANVDRVNAGLIAVNFEGDLCGAAAADRNALAQLFIAVDIDLDD